MTFIVDKPLNNYYAYCKDMLGNKKYQIHIMSDSEQGAKLAAFNKLAHYKEPIEMYEDSTYQQRYFTKSCSFKDNGTIVWGKWSGPYSMKKY